MCVRITVSGLAGAVLSLLICSGCAGEKLLVEDAKSEVEVGIALDLVDLPEVLPFPDVPVDPGSESEVVPPDAVPDGFADAPDIPVVPDAPADMGPEADGEGPDGDVTGDWVGELTDQVTLDFEFVKPEYIPEEGDFLWPCTSNADCYSGYCVVTEQYGTVCTVQCIEACPLNWVCKGMDLGDDVVFLCVAPENDLCAPCQVHDQCGGPGDLCLEVGIGAGKFCTMACGPAAGPGQPEECPEDYVCAAVEVDGEATWQCWPESDSCICLGDLNGAVQACLLQNEFGKCYGEMTCNGPYGWSECDAAIPAPEVCNGLDDDCDGEKDNQLEPTPCENVNQYGTCTGLAVCQGQEGWACSAPQPGPEICDGVDNDCDGEMDEPNLVQGVYVALCEDDNECTADQCNGADGCEHEAMPDGTPCSADPGWICVAGECVPE